MGFLTALATGGFEGANDILENNRKQAQSIFQERLKSVDKAAEKYYEYQNKAKDIDNLSRSFQGQYNIDPDLAYNLAVDPKFKELGPSDRLAYLKGMQPTNQYTSASPGGSEVISPGQRLRGGLFGGVDLPETRTPSYPATPARRIYQFNGMPVYPKGIEDVAPGALPPDPNVQKAYGNYIIAKAHGEQPSVQDINTVMFSVAPKDKQAAIKEVSDQIAAGHGDANNGETIFQQMTGGRFGPSGMQWGNIHMAPVDRERNAKIQQYVNRFGMSVPEATKQVDQLYKVGFSQNTGEAGSVVDMTGIKPSTGQNTTPGVQPQGGGTTPTSGITKASVSGAPQQGTQTTTAPVDYNPGAPNPNIGQGGPSVMAGTVIRNNLTASQEDQKNAIHALHNGATTMTQINGAIKALNENPDDFVGWKPYLTQRFGGALINGFRLLNDNVHGDQLAKWTNLQGQADFYAKTRLLMINMAHTIQQQGRLSNMDLQLAQSIAGHAENPDFHYTTENVKADMTELRNLQLEIYMKNLRMISPIDERALDMTPSASGKPVGQEFAESRVKWIAKTFGIPTNVAKEVVHKEVARLAGIEE